MLDNQFIYSLITAIFVGGAAGYLGSLMVTKRMALVGDALGHVALPGVALALVYNFNVIVGALASLFFGIILIWLFKTKTEIYMEALVGVVFAVSLAVAFLILSHEELEEALIGDIAKVSGLETIISVILISIIFLIIRKFLPKMILGTLSEELAMSQKINVKKCDFIYLMSVGFIVALGVKMTGSLLIGALVVIPPAAARNFSRTLRQYSYGGMIIGIISCVLGIIIYKITEFPAGPIIILISAVIFLISFIFRRE
ncbi:metal ABC transporter permease [Patescibacteria group bacterium]|nr:metal ABC transporter permease [Patescibacteria group bacterium]